MNKFFIALLISLSVLPAFALSKHDGAIKAEQVKMEEGIRAVRNNSKIPDSEKHVFMLEQRSWEVQINNACTTDKSCILTSLTRRNEYIDKLLRR